MAPTVLPGMTASDTSPSEGEKVEVQSDELLGLFHGTTSADLELEVTPKDDFIQIDLRGPPNVTLLVTAERAERIIKVLSWAVEDLEGRSEEGAV